MRIVLRYYQLSLMYNNRLVTIQCIDTLNNSALSDLPILTHIVWEYCRGISLALKLISSITPSANVSGEFLTPVTTVLACTLYPRCLLDDIRDMLPKRELTKDSIWKIHLHNLEAAQWNSYLPYLSTFSTGQRQKFEMYQQCMALRSLPGGPVHLARFCRIAAAAMEYCPRSSRHFTCIIPCD